MRCKKNIKFRVATGHCSSFLPHPQTRNSYLPDLLVVSPWYFGRNAGVHPWSTEDKPMHFVKKTVPRFKQAGGDSCQSRKGRRVFFNLAHWVLFMQYLTLGGVMLPWMIPASLSSFRCWDTVDCASGISLTMSPQKQVSFSRSKRMMLILAGCPSALQNPASCFASSV